MTLSFAHIRGIRFFHGGISLVVIKVPLISRGLRRDPGSLKQEDVVYLDSKCMWAKWLAAAALQMFE